MSLYEHEEYKSFSSNILVSSWINDIFLNKIKNKNKAMAETGSKDKDQSQIYVQNI